MQSLTKKIERKMQTKMLIRLASITIVTSAKRLRNRVITEKGWKEHTGANMLNTYGGSMASTTHGT